MIFIEYYHDIVIRKILDNISNFYLPNIEDNPIIFFLNISSLNSFIIINTFDHSNMHLFHEIIHSYELIAPQWQKNASVLN